MTRRSRIYLRKSFPKLENWKDIYPTQTMRVLVSEAYEQGISFCRVASEYLTRFSSKSPLTLRITTSNYFTPERVAMAIISPPSMGIDKAAALIHKTLAEINSEAMYIRAPWPITAYPTSNRAPRRRGHQLQ